MSEATATSGNTALDTKIKTDQIVVNMGPQHPSTHGVLRLMLTLDGETVVDAEVVLGYLHRGFEKLCEEGTYTQNISLTDRLDYFNSMNNNWAYVKAVEMIMGIEVPERAEYLRVIMSELQRLVSHLACTGFYVSDIGAMHTPLLYAFRQREEILDLFEMACGARMTCNYFRIGGVSKDVPDGWIARLKAFLDQLPSKIDELEGLLTGNEILVARSKGVGVMTSEMAINYSITGPCLRATGVQFDLRKDVPYSVYPRLSFNVPTLRNGDVMDRFLLRILEMRECVKIIKQAIEQLPEGEVRTPVPLNLRPPIGEALSRIEGPKGEMGYYVVSDGSIAPYRVHQRPPCFINLGIARELFIGTKVADVVAILASLDPIMGEVDR
ncbi:MAG: NADH-quinone oxidoreductase subunit D [Chloroflexi bacterium]|nr:NADH-quinone oxidoreductase subunit D [Chloroflexota bacterium]MDA8188339.1 NADH-quinone oxidoreductase subunit D [Dehalococcoidales bacterium]